MNTKRSLTPFKAPFSLFSRGATILYSLIFLAFGLYRAFYPSLHMDEGYYLGAALRILKGDLFLTGYAFDKIPLAPYLMIPGILIAGENPLGFHLSGLIASWVGFLSALGLITRLCRSWLATLVAQFFYLLLNLLPFMVFQHGSSLTDPFLLMFLLLFLSAAQRCLSDANEITRRRYENHAYHFFSLALATKFQALMWLPCLLGFWFLRFGVAEKKAWLGTSFLRLWKVLRWYAALALVFMLTSPTKFAPISWFSHLFRKETKSTDNSLLSIFWTRSFEWLQTAQTVLGASWVSWIFVSLAIFISVRLMVRAKRSGLKRKELTSDMILTGLVVIPFWCYAGGLVLSGATVFSRYLYCLTPLFVLLLIAGFPGRERVFRPSRWKFYERIAYMGLLGIGAYGLLSEAGSLPKQKAFMISETLPPETGRLFFKIRDQLPRGSWIHNESRLWWLHPFTLAANLRPSCMEDRCCQEAQIGRCPFDKQFRLMEMGDGHVELEQALPQNCPGPGHPPLAAQQKRLGDLSMFSVLNENLLRSALRIGPWAESVTWKTGACQNCPSPSEETCTTHQSCALHWQRVPSGLVL